MFIVITALFAHAMNAYAISVQYFVTNYNMETSKNEEYLYNICFPKYAFTRK